MSENRVSAITVTRNRVKFLQKSIEYFINQTYDNKEMLIMYYDDDDETKNYLLSLDKTWRNDNNIRIFKHIPMEGIYLGSLRNFLIEQSTGEYIIIWDDDDYHAPERIEFQLEEILKDDLVACTLKSLLIFSETRQEVKLSFERIEGWEGTLMCLKDKMPLYMNLQRYEDTPVLENLFLNQKAKSVHNPDLYVYYLHSNNISTEYHKEELFFNSYELTGAKNFEIKTKIGFFL